MISKLPKLTYPGIGQVANLTKRVSSPPAATVPLSIPDGMRSDLIADRYYGSDRYQWTLAMANNVSDPTEMFVLTEHQLIEHAENVYGTVAIAAERIIYWKFNRNQFGSAPLSQQAFNALPPEQQPLFFETVGGFVPTKDDVIVPTNALRTFETTTPAFFPRNASVVFKNGSQTIATGQVASSNKTHLVIQHIQGDVESTDITSIEMGVFSATVQRVGPLVRPIGPELVSAFAPVTGLEHLREENERRRNRKAVAKEFIQAYEAGVEQQLA